MGESLKKQAIKGVAWSAVERFSAQGVQFVLTIILARLVAPSEYGLIAMLGIFLAIAQSFIDSGFSNALIQKQDRTETDYSTVFYFNIAVAGIVYVILFICSPYIAGFYKEPQLEIITKWVGLNIVISAFSIVQRAKLTVKLDFKMQTKVSLLSIIVSGCIGITLAYQGFGVWTLVIQALSSSLLNTLLLWIFAKWTPSLTFSWQSFHTLFSFGSKLLLSGLLHTIYINLYSLVIGRRYSSTEVGYYNRAYQFAAFPSTNIVGIVGRAIYPVQCRLQDDEERLNTTFIQYLRMACYVIFPLMVGLAVLAKPLTLLLLTEKWLSAAKLLSILCMAYMWYPVMVINNQILNVRGRSDYFLKAEIIKKAAAIGILVLTMPWGLKALCWGLVAYNWVDMIIIIYYAKKVIRTGYIRQIKNIAPFFLLTVGMGGIMLLSTMCIHNTIFKLLGGILTGIVSYFILSFLFRIREFISIIHFTKVNLFKNYV
ncbi:Teichuronic acid biosynthesis protein TuaB [termite gut metagenome]|uniref:Teichuronic acid biosynthesis protein TuaB n=1 Tax=termite gut metagenome TaxID=433724 RepID=A0A5J4RWQ7_9ZZZZ